MNHFRFTRLIVFLAAGILARQSQAQLSYDSQEQVYTQSFDALPSSGSSFLWTDNSTLSGWYVGSSASSFNGTLGISTGSTTTGNIYSFGLANATERALGSIASGSTNFFYGLKAINNTATTITGFTISYTGEQWRNSAAAAQSLSFQYSIGATTLKNGNYVTVPMVGFSSPITGGTAGLLNGNLTANRVNVGPITVSNLNWLPGTPLWLRFTDIDDAGYDHGLAIDNFSFAAAGTAPAWDPPAGYYDAATGLSGEPLAAALHGIIKNNLVVPYSSTATIDTKAALKSLFEDPADATKIQLTYSGNSVLKTDPNWDRERLWPTSRGIASTDNADSDLFNLRPSYSSINSARNNKLYDNSDWYDTNYASPAAALAAADTSTDSNSWQPPASEVGDIARALFYMDVRYNGGDGNALDLALDNGIVNGSSMAVLSTLLQWSHDDPVSEEERKRNATIYSIYQHNRNPFVDHPEYVDSVFGYLVTEADDLDLDGIPNDWENAHQFNPTDATDANADTDTDGFTNTEEAWMESDPRDPASPARFLVDRASTASAQDGSLASPFKTIQAAINALGPNDIRAIVVRPGTYPERPYANGKNILHLFSEAGAGATIIDGQQVDSSVVRLYAFQKASFVGFTVRNAATSNFGAGLRIDAASGTALIANNILTSNTSTNTTNGGGGLYLKTAHHSRVLNNFILGNTATRGGGVLFAGGDADFWFNTVAGNAATAGNGGGLSAMQGVHPDVRDNILWNNTGSAPAAQLHQISPTYARDNLVQNAAANSGNLSADPLFIGNGDYHLSATSPAKDAAFALPVVTDFDGDPRPGALGPRDLGADEIVTTSNDPVAQNQSVTLPEDSSASIVLGPVLPEGWTYSVQTPSHGSATAQEGTCTYLPVAHYNGADSFTFQLRKNGQVQSTATITLTITPVDDPPLVDAGTNQVLVLPATANLAATITDIDTPAANLTCTWSQEDGPGSVAFGTASARTTTATFSTAGDYLLVLTVSDGTSTRSDSVKVVVNAAASALGITLSSPANNSVYLPPAPIPLIASVTGGIPTKVEFYEGTRRVGVSTTSPYSISWKKSLPGAYRVTALATDNQGNVSVSAPVLIQVGATTGGTDLRPGNEGGSGGNNNGDGKDGNGGGGGNLDPNGDDDGDGAENGVDAYPQDDRRKEDLPIKNYALIDLGQGVIPDNLEVDQIAMGQDGRVAFSWWVGDNYKVAKWKNGQLETGSPKTAPLDTPTATFGFRGRLSASGEMISALENPHPTNGPNAPTTQVILRRCSYGATSIEEIRSSTDIKVFGDLAGTFKEDGTFLTMVSYWPVSDGFGLDDGKIGKLTLTAGNTSPSFQEVAINSPGYKWYHSFGHVWETWSGSGVAGVNVYGPEFLGYTGPDWNGHFVRGNYVQTPGGTVAMINGDVNGTHGEWQSSVAEPIKKPFGQITVINDRGDFVLSGSDTGKSLYYKDNASVGELRTLLPDLYSQQIRYGADATTAEAQMSSLSNAGQLLFSMENLEGTGRGSWKKGTFVSDKIVDPANPDSNLRNLMRVKFPDNYDITLKGGPQGITDTGLLAATIKKTKNDNGTPIPPADQKKKPGYLMHCALAVDANRDGAIDFDNDQTTTEKPFRFWLNDDDDRDDEDHPGSSTQDKANSIIESKRDLEDFTRLHIHIGGLQDAIAKGDIQVGLEWKDVAPGTNPAIKIYTAAEIDGKDQYLKTDLAALNQSTGPAATALGTISNGGAFKFPKSFWEAEFASGRPVFSTTDPNRYLIFEGSGEGKGRLVLTFWKGTQRLGEGGDVWIKIQNVRSMYERAKITVDASQIPHPWDNPNPPPLSWGWDPWNWQPDIDPNAEKKTIVYVHGWRLPYNESISWGDTTYKRLWQMGYKGRFYAFRWPTFSGENDGLTPADFTDTPGGLTYNASEYRAWLSGPALANFVNGLPNSNDRYLMAHSMGNVISGAALRAGMKVTRYAMCNAAVSAMAYNGTLAPDNPSFQTPDTDADTGTRQTFGLADKFNPASAPIVNFSLPNDSALGQWSSNNELFKPQGYVDFNRNFYLYSQSSQPGQKLRIVSLSSQPATTRNVTSLPEAMAYVVQSRTRAAGAKQNTGGSATPFVNMGTGGFEFGNTHSAEWIWTYQKTYPFWRRLAEEFTLDLTNR